MIRVKPLSTVIVAMVSLFVLGAMPTSASAAAKCVEMTPTITMNQGEPVTFVSPTCFDDAHVPGTATWDIASSNLASGSVAIRGTGFTRMAAYTPAITSAGNVGTFTLGVTFMPNDPNIAPSTTQVVVTVVVTPVQLAPVCPVEGPSVVAMQSTPIHIDLGCVDPNGDPITYKTNDVNINSDKLGSRSAKVVSDGNGILFTPGSHDTVSGKIFVLAADAAHPNGSPASFTTSSVLPAPRPVCQARAHVDYDRSSPYVATITGCTSPSGRPLTYKIVEPAKFGGTSTMTASGTFTYTAPRVDRMIDSDIFIFTASDGVYDSYESSVSIAYFTKGLAAPLGTTPVTAPLLKSLDEGLTTRTTCTDVCTLNGTATVDAATAARLGLSSTSRAKGAKPVLVASGRGSGNRTTGSIVLGFTAKAKAKLKAKKITVKLTQTIKVTTKGKTVTKTRIVTLKP